MSEIKNSRCAVYDINWQKIRINLLVEFNKNKKPNNTIIGLRETFTVLKDYLNEHCTMYEKHNRLYRVINLIDAIQLATLPKLCKTEDEMERKRLVKEFRREMAKEYKALKRRGVDFAAFDWDKFKIELRDLYKENLNIFIHLRDNLIRRKKTAIRKTGTMSRRPELAKVLNEIERVWIENGNESDVIL